MIYNLNNVSLIAMGFIPGLQESSHLAIAGNYDMPARLGKTFHDWAGENGIEPYVAASEIYFGGRSITLTGYVNGIDYDQCESKRLAIVSLVNSFTGLVPLQTDWDTYNVFVNGAIKGEWLSPLVTKLDIPFREPQPVVSGIALTKTNAEFGIDGISFKDMGGYYLELSGDRLTRPDPKDQQFTAYGKEGYQITNVKASELLLKLYIEQPSMAEFIGKIKGMYQLFASPGLRSLTVYDDKLRSFFVKEGFTVKQVQQRGSGYGGFIECKLTEAGSPGTYTNLIDYLNNTVTDNLNDIIKVLI